MDIIGKYDFLLSAKEVSLMSQKQAIILAKKSFEKYKKELFKCCEDRLSFNELPVRS